MTSTTPIELGAAGVRLKTVVQRSNENKPYRFTVQGGAIDSSAWTVTPAGPAISTPTNTSGASSATSDVLISGIVAGTNYTVECAAMLTTSGQIHTGVIVIQGIATISVSGGSGVSWNGSTVEWGGAAVDWQ